MILSTLVYPYPGHHGDCFFETWRLPAQIIHNCGQRSEVLPYLYIFTCSQIRPRCFHYLRVPKARRLQYGMIIICTKGKNTENRAGPDARVRTGFGCKHNQKHGDCLFHVSFACRFQHNPTISSPAGEDCPHTDIHLHTQHYTGKVSGVKVKCILQASKHLVETCHLVAPGWIIRESDVLRIYSVEPSSRIND